MRVQVPRNGRCLGQCLRAASAERRHSLRCLSPLHWATALSAAQHLIRSLMTTDHTLAHPGHHTSPEGPPSANAIPCLPNAQQGVKIRGCLCLRKLCPESLAI